MHLTRRGWAVAALVVSMAAYAAVLDRPLALAGAALVGAWLLARQYRFVLAVDEAISSLAVSQVPHRSGARTGETVAVTLTAAIDSATDIPPEFELSIAGGLPTAAAGSERLEIALDGTRYDAERTIDVEWPVAGNHRFRPATVTVTDGVFHETVPVGDQPTVTVEPRGPRSIHVGKGGDRMAMAFSEHKAGRSGSGIEPAEIQEYVPGDQIQRIDWKATARQGTPHVRRYEAETNRRTLLVIDHRASLAVGPPAESKFDYLRDVALATAASARRLGDPTSLVTIGDAGVTNRISAAKTPDAYSRIRDVLLELEPTPESHPESPVFESPTPTTSGAHVDGQSPVRAAAPTPEGRSSTTGSDGEPASASANDDELTAPATGDRTADGTRTPTARQTGIADARRSLAALDGDDTFDRRLQPFYADRRSYLERVESSPLYAAVETTLSREAGRVWAVIFTDDTRPAEVRETVSYARSRGNDVLVLLTPTVLYEPGGMADLEQAYRRYAEFEGFRRDLHRMDQVTALEVGPADHLAAILGRRSNRGGRT